MNKIILAGRLTQDPQLFTLKDGLVKCDFTLAVDRDYIKNGEKKTDFIRCTAWRKDAEYLANYKHKGEFILLEGNLQIGEYTNKEGVKQTNQANIVVDRFHYCGGTKSDNANAKPAANAPAAANNSAKAPAKAQTNSIFEVDEDDDDLPF